MFDIDNLLTNVASAPWRATIGSAHTDTKGDVAAKRDFLRALLGSFLSCGLNDDIDRICHERIGLPKASTVVGMSR